MLPRLGFVVLGMLIMCGAWALEHPERQVWFVRFLDPAGYAIVSCYEKLSKGETVTRNDNGFTQVAAVVVRRATFHVPGKLLTQVTSPFPGPELLQEERLKILEVSSEGETGAITYGNTIVGPAILRGVSITYSLDQASQQEAGPADIVGFRDELVEIYVDKRIFRWSFVFFILGLAFFVISTISAMRLRETSIGSREFSDTDARCTPRDSN